MNHFVIVALCDELHLCDPPLCILKVILLDPSDHLLKCVVHHSNHKVALIRFKGSKSDCDALHVIEACCANEEQHLSENEFFILSPGHGEYV